MDGYTARASGSVGCEIMNPDGEIVAWTTDGRRAATLVALLNDAQERGLRPFRDMSGEAIGIANISPDGAEDSEAIAREAISHLAYHGLALRFDLPGTPSDAVRNMVESYLSDPEIGETLSDSACQYVIRRLADDHLGLRAIDMPEERQNHSARE
jgi:hypothetical protein